VCPLLAFLLFVLVISAAAALLSSSVLGSVTRLYQKTTQTISDIRSGLPLRCHEGKQITCQRVLKHSPCLLFSRFPGFPDHHVGL
jgi:hypothetical protein